ncbi:polysaccharide biosynthesis tyrosine autokinase [Yoonia sp.]|uniref:polysaccharide biosynthesis tyrosine autokinase n=1 Tax=Yoonia sp. TaxID=2212373 RepID=UPI001A075C79|nr:AAA family ATPase [Yoonia sp.]MBE0412432.1 AAA family ATPase [Yoonia sp.]
MFHQVKNGHPAFQQFGVADIQPIAPLDISGLLRRIWLGKYVIMICTLLAVLAAGFYAFRVAQPRYAATTTLEINRSSVPYTEIGQIFSDQGTDPAHINTQVAILQSKHLLTQVVAARDLMADPEFNRYLTPIPPLSLIGVRNLLRNFLTGQSDVTPDSHAVQEKTVQNLRAAVTATALRDTYVFQITAITSTPEKSAQIANTLADVYLADQVAGKRAETEMTLRWLSDKVSELRGQLEMREAAINDLRTQTHVKDQTTFDALDRQATDAARRLAAAQAELDRAQTALDRTTRAKPIAAQTGTIYYDSLSADVARYTRQVAALSQFQTNLQRQLAESSAGMIQLDQLRREVDATRVTYETFLARLQQASTRRGLQTAGSRVLATASPGTYVAPRKVLILAAAGLLGALGGGGLVVLAGALRSGFGTAAALHHATGLPVMAQTPRIAGRTSKQVLDWLQQNPNSAAADASRSLRTALFLADHGKVPQVIMFTSTLHGEGKTTNAIALANTLAKLDKSVLLIEADMRHSSFYQYFQQVPQMGLAAVLQGDTPVAEAIFPDTHNGFDMLAARPTAQNPADLLAKPAFAALLTGLRQTYDHIILDAPPVLPFADVALLVQQTDAVIYTVQWNKTPAHLVLMGCDALRAARAPMTGLILAQVAGQA